MSLSAPGVLREALRIAGRCDRIVGFPDSLACGPIDPPSPAARLHWLVERLGFQTQDWVWLPRSVYRFWRRALAPCARRIVWTSSRSANEHAAFLSWVERAGGLPYDVIDLADLEITQGTGDGRHWHGQAKKLGLLAPEVVAAEALWEQARPLAWTESVALLESWRRLRSENAPLRMIGPEGLVSADISAFDAALISYASALWRPAIHLIGHMIAEGDGDYFQVSDHFLAARLVYLIGSGALECRRTVSSDTDATGYQFGLTNLKHDMDVRVLVTKP